jgi:hypothetical protein
LVDLINNYIISVALSKKIKNIIPFMRVESVKGWDVPK